MGSGADVIVIDGMQGGTAATQDVFIEHVGIPTLAAIPLAVQALPLYISQDLHREASAAGLILGLCAALEIPGMLGLGALMLAAYRTYASRPAPTAAKRGIARGVIGTVISVERRAVPSRLSAPRGRRTQ